MPNYDKTILCLANSRKTSGRCIAGRELVNDKLGAWIRPISDRETAELSEVDRRFENGRDPSVLDIIRIPMIKPKPHAFQTENHLILLSHKVAVCGGSQRITRRFPFIERFFADAGYQGPRVAKAAPRSVEIIKRTDAGFVVQPKRWVIERTFAWACVNRRLAKDFERFAVTAQALFQIAMIKLMTRRIARYRDF